MRTTPRPTPPAATNKPPASKSATFLPDSSLSRTRQTPMMPGAPSSPGGPSKTGAPSVPSHRRQANVVAYRALRCFRYWAPKLDIVTGTFGSLQQGTISAFLHQAAHAKEQIGHGINLLSKDLSIPPLHRVLIFSRHWDKAWQILTGMEDAKLILSEGIDRKMEEVAGHSSKFLLNRLHWCINDNAVSTATTALYGMPLRHAEQQFVMLDNVRMRLLADLLSAARSGRRSFPATDLAIEAFTLLPDGSFNMPAFERLKTALNVQRKEDQVAQYMARNVGGI